MSVTPFIFEGSPVRVIDRDGEPWFVAVDVARLLGYSNPQEAVREHCRGVSEALTPSAGGRQRAKIIPERDVYRLIMRSKLPAAERFEEWVVGEVLPSIRKTGAYGRAEMDWRGFAKAVEQARRIDRNAALDMVREVLPVVAVGAHRVAVLPHRPLPTIAAAAVLERLQQREVTWSERAEAYAEMLAAGHSVAEVANVAGRTKRHVEVHLKMLRDLSPSVLDLVRGGRLRANHARALLDLPHAAQDLAVKLIVKGAVGWRTYRDIRGSLRRQRSIAVGSDQ